MPNRPSTHRAFLDALVCSLLVTFTCEATLTAQELEPPQYPRVNMCPSYEVDPDWPQKPDDVNWAAMPGIAVDGEDNVWLFTRATPPIQVYDSEGRYIKGWGSDFIGKAHQIKFDHEGNVWLADVGNHVILKCSPEGKVLTSIGTSGVAGEDERHFNKPTDMVVSPTGDIFVSDGYGNSRVVHFDTNGNYVKAWGKLGTRPGEFSIPHAIAMDAQGRLYVADRNNARVQVFDQDGKFLDEWRDLLVPWGFCVTKSDEIWVCGSSPMTWRSTDQVLGCPPKDQVFMKFATSGRLLQLWTVPKGEDDHERPGDCNWLHGIALDSHGNIYVGDIIGERAQKFVRQE